MSTTEMVIRRLDEELEELVAQMNLYFRQIKSGKCLQNDLLVYVAPLPLRTRSRLMVVSGGSVVGFCFQQV